MRILHAPSNTADQPGTVVRALRSLGHEAELWEYGESRFGFARDRGIDVSDGDARVHWETFREAIERFDVFHFHYARSFFPSGKGGVPPYWDLPILRLLGKKVFFTFHGSDCRMRRIHENYNPWSYFKHSDLDADDDRIAKKIQVIRTFAHRMFVVSLEYLPFVPDAEWLPRALDLELIGSSPFPDRAEPVILHVPSQRGTKGTDMIVAGMEQLQAEGLAFDFRLIEGVSHEEALRQMRNADVVIDNIVTGDYEVVSLEAMAIGRVAVAFLQDRVKTTVPSVPVVQADPSDFVDRMRALLADRSLRRDAAARGRAFVSEHHDAKRIAGRLVDAYASAERDVPARAFPDWIGFSSERRLENLEEKVAELETERARLRLRERELRGRVKELVDKLAEPPPWSPKDMVPPAVRLALRRGRAKLKK